MTTGQTISPLDRTERARLDDDGAPIDSPASRPHPADPGPSPAAEDRAEARLALSPTRGQGLFDGGWWPRSLRLGDELPALLTALADADVRVSRLSVNGDVWAAIPAHVAQADRHGVRISWFRTIDPWTITLSSGGSNSRVRLLVIAPDTAPADAARSLDQAAAGGETAPTTPAAPTTSAPVTPVAPTSPAVGSRS